MLSNKPRPAAAGNAAATKAMPVAEAPKASPSAAGQTIPAPAGLYESHPLRKVFLYFALAALFVRLSTISEVIAYSTGISTYFLYLVAPPAVLGVLLTGGLQRMFRSRAPYFWLAFFAWMVLAAPFSFWKGGSIQRVITYGRVDIMLLFLVAGLAVTWKDIRATFCAIAVAAVVCLSASRLFMQNDNGRISLAGIGSIGNSNDLAAQLLLLLPFLLFFALGRRASVVIRIAALGLIAYGIRVILGTASRGALIALFAVLLCILLRASLFQRIAMVLIGLVLTGVMMVSLPAATLTRLGALFGAKDAEAAESSDSRWYLFKKSVQYTIQHPLFGVGPDEFSNYEGESSLAEGRHGNWHATHNAYTEVSSECGIPALIFFVAGLASAIRLVMRTYRQAKREGYGEIADACFCYLIAMTGYLGALTFLANAYSYTLPAMVGIAVAMSFAAQRHMRAGGDRRASKSWARIPRPALQG